MSISVGGSRRSSLKAGTTILISTEEVEAGWRSIQSLRRSDVGGD